MSPNKICISVLAVIILAVQIGAAVPVNETIGDYRISFDAEDNTLGAIGKLWNNSGDDLFGINEPSNSDIIKDMFLSAKEAYFAGAGIPEDDSPLSFALVLVLEKAVNVSNVGENFLMNRSDNYIRVYDRTIDNHKGVLTQSGDNSTDPSMEYAAIYCLDENENGESSKWIIVVTTLPWKDGAEKFMNTIHVEELPEQEYR